jgi:hypothetical protein
MQLRLLHGPSAARGTFFSMTTDLLLIRCNSKQLFIANKIMDTGGSKARPHTTRIVTVSARATPSQDSVSFTSVLTA